MRQLVTRLVARLKRQPDYQLDARLSLAQLRVVLWHRGWQFVRGLALPVLAADVQRPVFRGKRVDVRHAGQLRAGPGLILEDGVLLDALSRDGLSLGRNVTIARGASLLCTGVIAQLGVGIRIGDRCAIGAGSFLGGQGGILVGNDVIMGPGVRMLSENHRFDDTGRTIREQGVRRQGIIVHDDCWIGAGVTIVDGVTIGRGCVIGAASVVTRDAPPESVLAGSPARVLRNRTPSSREDAIQAVLPAATDSRAKSLL